MNAVKVLLPPAVIAWLEAQQGETTANKAAEIIIAAYEKSTNKPARRPRNGGTRKGADYRARKLMDEMLDRLGNSAYWLYDWDSQVAYRAFYISSTEGRIVKLVPEEGLSFADAHDGGLWREVAVETFGLFYEEFIPAMQALALLSQWELHT